MTRDLGSEEPFHQWVRNRKFGLVLRYLLSIRPCASIIQNIRLYHVQLRFGDLHLIPGHKLAKDAAHWI